MVKLPIGSEGICPHCEHRDRCPFSSWYNGMHLFCKLACDGTTEVYSPDTNKTIIYKHHKFKLRKEERKNDKIHRNV